MEQIFLISQTPEPGSVQLVHCGDQVTFTLELPKSVEGRAWVRTDLGRGGHARTELVNRIQKGEIKLEGAWHDIPMVPTGDTSFALTLGCHETGYFLAKCFFLPRDTRDPVWPPGENSVINVDPAGTCCANIIYNAFVRQFGPSKEKMEAEKETKLLESLDEKGYAVIPRSGKFRDLIQELDFIFTELGCRVLHLLPVHPTPTTYGRMGRFGSPYAALSFTDVDPALAEFDAAATPMEQFMELADAVHAREGYLVLDIAINHTGWAAAIHESHPEWLVRGDDGRIEVPGAWGVRWEDLTKLDYSNRELWQYMAGIFLLWCRRGVDGFRCDAGYMIPVEAWEYMVARVRQAFPDTLFFLEGLGGGMDATVDILNRGNFNWAYSELFQNYDRSQLEHYLPQAFRISRESGHLIHFAETHDNPRLARISPTYARMRTALSALFSVSGGFGFTNGVEWFAREKINVHQASSLNWGAGVNQVANIRRLNRILTCHPAFFDGVTLALIQRGDGNALALMRIHESTGKRVLVLVNLDSENSQSVQWEPGDAGFDREDLLDLVTGENVRVTAMENIHGLSLNPGQFLALTQDARDLVSLDLWDNRESPMPERVLQQHFKALVLRIIFTFREYGDLAGFDIEAGAAHLKKDPVGFCRALNPTGKESRVIPWCWERDLKRRVMVPPGFFIMVEVHTRFRVQVIEKRAGRAGDAGVREGRGGDVREYGEGLPGDGGRFFAMLGPFDTKGVQRELELYIRVFDPAGTREGSAPILCLGEPGRLRISPVVPRRRILRDPSLKLLGTTGHGGMMRAPAWWGRLESRYDGLIAANRNPSFPEDRWMSLARVRIWAVFQGYPRELSIDTLETFHFSWSGFGKWSFRVPTSQGSYCHLDLFLASVPGKNAVALHLFRRPAGEGSRFLRDDAPIRIIIRPDVEYRSFHDTVKAYTGPEGEWPSWIQNIDNGFYFSCPESRDGLGIRVSCGAFVLEPEWQYMVHRPLEEERGLDADSDLFSPGYFTSSLTGGRTLFLSALFGTLEEGLKEFREGGALGIPGAFKQRRLLGQAARESLGAFVCRRGDFASVIAGYPWFLDWGRDSLIFCRGLIGNGREELAKEILRLFGRFEEEGTLPNMIRGRDAGNRETSDAPLWFFAACRDLTAEQGPGFLDEDLEGRTVGEVLFSIALSLIRGTPTGVKMDSESGLLFSPAHFTWMDTNFPAGSPREGYPVEIQALWYYALEFLADIDPRGEKGGWQAMADQVRESVENLFFQQDLGWYSDCLHGKSGEAAASATADDALRPNQLFLITLGVVRDEERCRALVESCQELLVPGAIRSLADRKLSYPLHIYHDGDVLVDPFYPYAGHYLGDEDRARKPAYHNGTAWTWPFPVFCEAWARVFGGEGVKTALAYLGSAVGPMEEGAAGYLPEIMDGDTPHHPRGCDAQAWGSSELARVWNKLTKED